MPVNPTQASRVGRRVERFRFADKRAVKARAPWAELIVKVGSVYVAYESAEDAGDEHAPLSDTRNAVSPAFGQFRFGKVRSAM